jgi:hypothetical protein
VNTSPLGLHLPDADQLTPQEIGAVLELKPSAMLCLVYAQWDNDKGVARQVIDLVHSLRHDRLYVRFHADPHPPGYARRIGGARAWGRLCAQRMTQYYGELAGSGVQLHAILANELDADYEGGLDPHGASSFLEGAMRGYREVRDGDILHVPAPTGAPETHRRYLQQFKDDGWLYRNDDGSWPYWIDGHGYDGDLENVIAVLEQECPGATYVITETNDLHDFGWPIALLGQGRARDIVYFTLNWARGGEGRVQPPSADDAAKQMSLLRFPDRYAQFKATIGASPSDPVGPSPEPPPLPVPTQPEVFPFPLPVDGNGNEWQASTQDVLDAILDVAPRVIDPSRPRQAIKLLLACGIAESREDFQSQERWHIWTNHGIEAVRQRNLGYAAQVLGWGRDVGAIGTNDFSAGPFHQAMAWHEDFPGNPTDPNDPHRWDVMLWLNFRKRMIQDHGYATEYAARRLKAYYDQRPDDLQWCLERYNKPSDEVSNGVRANYARALATAESWLVAWGAAADRPAEPVPSVPAPPSSTATKFESYTDPRPAGAYAQMPRGCILHGSRSGRRSNPLAAEYAGTASYEVNNPAGLGWTATIGDGVVAVHMDARHWGWNARAASRHYLAVEFAQPTNANEITDGQVRAFCDWWRTHVLPVWPGIPHFFPSHAEVEHSGETGVRDGKDDAFPYGDPRMDDLRARIVANLSGAVPPDVDVIVVRPDDVVAVPESDQSKIARMVSAIGFMGGDVANAIEHVRAGVDDGIDRPSSSMTKAELKASLERFWQRWDAAYAQLGEQIDQLRRVRDEQLK